jgi:hypothetical protein
LVNPIFPLEAVLIGKQMGLTAASGNAVIPKTYGRIHKSAASFSHGKSPSTNNRFGQKKSPNPRVSLICCACPFFPVQAVTETRLGSIAQSNNQPLPSP